MGVRAVINLIDFFRTERDFLEFTFAVFTQIDTDLFTHAMLELLDDFIKR
jgi:hypothetical protein